MAATEKDAKTIAFAKELDNTPWCDDYEKMISGVLYELIPLLRADNPLRDRGLPI